MTSADCLQQLYDDTLSTLLDKYAPRRVVRRHHVINRRRLGLTATVLPPSVVQGCLSVDTAALVQLLIAVRGLLKCDVNSDSIPGK